MTQAAPPSAKRLNLEALKLWAQTNPNITEAYITMIAESASVCFFQEKHPITLDIHVIHEDVINKSFALKQTDSKIYKLKYLRVTQAMTTTYNDEHRTTEDGACAIALLMINAERGLSFLKKSQRTTGYDYWVGDLKTKGVNFFSDHTRLEVSGIRNGTDADIQTRKKEKIVQTTKSDKQCLPVYVIVVEFGQPGSHIVFRTVMRSNNAKH